jgi:alkylation response protein AidB-like acyl-CoA dehydrogenase
MTLNHPQQELQKRARALARETIAPRAAEVDRTEQYPWENVKALNDAGFFGMTIPKAYGGAGLGFLDACLVVDEIAQVCGVSGRIVVEANMGAISAVMHYGSGPQKKLAAELVLSGDKPAICITEPSAGSAASEMTTRADRKGNGYVINGSKHWITGGGVSRLHLVFARVFDAAGEEQGIGGFLAVREKTNGLVIGKREPTMGLRGIPETEILFRDMEVGDDMVVLPPSGFRRGFADLMNRLQFPARRRGHRGAGPRRRRLPACAGLRQFPKPVRTPDRRIPGAAMDAGRHVGANRCRARTHSQGRAFQFSISRSAVRRTGKDFRR